MPFKSDAQRRFMYAKHPGIAKRWRREYGPQTNLPEKKTDKTDRAVKGLKAAKP
jgi:hypothetical protein